MARRAWLCHGERPRHRPGWRHARARKLRRCAAGRARARRHRQAQPDARRRDAGRSARQADADRNAVAGRGEPPPASLHDRGRAGRGAPRGRLHRRRAGPADRLRRSRRQRLAGGQPVHGDREQGEPPARRGDLRQRPAARRDRTEEPRRRERDPRWGLQPVADLQVADHRRCSAPMRCW